jgi:hypothetical protein
MKSIVTVLIGVFCAFVACAFILPLRPEGRLISNEGSEDVPSNASQELAQLSPAPVIATLLPAAFHSPQEQNASHGNPAPKAPSPANASVSAQTGFGESSPSVVTASSLPSESFQSGVVAEGIQEILLPSGETIPMVLGEATAALNPAQQLALDNITENYLQNLESELMTTPQVPSTTSEEVDAIFQSLASRIADEDFRAIVGNQEADRIALENHLKQRP